MNAPISINDLGHKDIQAWLKRALQGQEPLPRLTSDESHYLGVCRLEKTLKPAARDSVREGCRQLVRQFCADGSGQPAYLEELLSLASVFEDPETVNELSALVQESPKFPNLPAEVRLSVLATLVDTPPPQSAEFWEAILRKNSRTYASFALSGVLAIDPERAIAMLPSLPDDEQWDRPPPSNWILRGMHSPSGASSLSKTFRKNSEVADGVSRIR
jgi:hypothetical protein